MRCETEGNSLDENHNNNNKNLINKTWNYISGFFSGFGSN
jgi:hypothetical protein